MNRRAFITGLGAVLAAPLAAEAQQAGKIPRIGFLAPTGPPSGPGSAIGVLIDGLRQGLMEHGYVEGRTIVIEYRWASGKFERLPDLAADLVRLNVDVIVAPTTSAARAAKHATATIPIVMSPVGDPVDAGLIVSLARPGGNVTGLALLSFDLMSKRLQLLKTAVSTISDVGVLVNPLNQATQTYMKHARAAALPLRLRLRPIEVGQPEELDRASDMISGEHFDGLLVTEDAIYFQWPERIAALAVKHRLPAMYAAREFVAAGGLMSYAPSLVDVFRRAGEFVGRILKGAQPADIPVEQPSKFEFAINLKAAKAIGLTIPQSLLLRADQVIE